MGLGVLVSVGQAANDIEGADFVKRRIRPILVKHCYECHSEEADEQQVGLLLDWQSGWLKGGEKGQAVSPGAPDTSLSIKAGRYDNEDFQMPSKNRSLRNKSACWNNGSPEAFPDCERILATPSSRDLAIKDFYLRRQPSIGLFSQLSTASRRTFLTHYLAPLQNSLTEVKADRT